MWSREIEQRVQEIFLEVDPDFDEASKGYFYRAQPLFYNKIHMRETLTYLLEKKLPETARILDYGCGAGQFLLFLWKFGFRNLHGWDQNKRWLVAGGALFKDLASPKDVAFKQIGREAIYDILGTAGQPFNVITMFGLIYGHGIDVPRTLKAVAAALAPGGRFMANDGKHEFHEMEGWIAEAGLILERSIVVRNRTGIENSIYFCTRGG
jgi:SAM-dependent methyltransferase